MLTSALHRSSLPLQRELPAASRSRASPVGEVGDLGSLNCASQNVRRAPPSRGVPPSPRRALHAATRADLEEFLGDDLLRRRSASTAATRYKVLRILDRWLEEEEDIPQPNGQGEAAHRPRPALPVIPDDGLLGDLQAASAS
jgi:hypothetical protein